MKTSFSRKKTIFLIRLMVIITTSYFIIFTPSSKHLQLGGYLFIAFYLATNLVVARIPDSLFYRDRIFYTLILCDSILLPAGIYFSGYVGSDLYLVYFFIISMTTMSARFEYLMINTFIFSIIYAWILHQYGYLTGPSAITYGLRIPMIMAIAMFNGYLITTRLTDKDDRIREAWERYEQIVQATDVLMCIVDQEGKLLFANQKFIKLYGREDKKSLLGLSYSEFHSEKESTNPISHIKKAIQTNNITRYESYDSNDKWFTNTLSPIRIPSNSEVLGVCIVSKDITERIEKEKKLSETVELLQRTRDQLIQKDKMAALGRMASGIAHEIRNPLEIIAMGMDYLDYNLSDQNPNFRLCIEKIHNAVTRANNIIKDILSFSRLPTFKIHQKIPLCPLLNNALALAKHNIRKNGVTLQREFENELLQVAADPNMIEHVLLNLINNAVDAMKNCNEKKLTIRAYEKKVTQIDYKTGYRQTDFFKIGDSLVVVEISDTGNGIPEDMLPKIFEPFFTTKSTNEGTGLGLSLAHMIMERLSSTINVESRVDQGTTFFLNLQPESKEV